jgi:hypothetical protein
VIADEAHRVAGKNDSPFQTVLDDRQIRSQRRLFVTATPRIYNTGLRKAAEEFGVEVVDMTDEKIFGKRFHTLTFGEAIKRELLTDYRVLIIGVDNDRTKEWIENRLLVATDTGLATDAKSLAAQVGLLKAIKDWDLRRVISFHGRVKRAKEFSEDIIQVGEWLDVTHRPSQSLWADHVSGEMPTSARRQKLKRPKYVGEEEIGLLSNARCLSEGVDVPALDGIAFIDPRSSEIDIIQSVGRAIRLSDNKTMGTIVIPVFIEQSDNAEAALEASEFKPIWDVLEALKSHDDRLSDELDQLRMELGAKKRRTVDKGSLTKIVFDLPTSVNDDFADSLRTHLVEQTTESWLFWYGLLKTFAKEKGHCRTEHTYKTDDGYRLGRWVGVQRANKNSKTRMNPDRRQRLEALPGWSWDAVADNWERGFSYLKEFSEHEGHCQVSQRYKANDGYRLGQWVAVQRRSKDTMEPDRLQRLEALPGWSWNTRTDQWEERFSFLKSFADREGHCRVPTFYRTPGGFTLGRWVSDQRERREKIDPSRRKRLGELPGWSWDTVSDQWEESFSRLIMFSEREGHCRVPSDHKTNDGYRLGTWVVGQRQAKNRMEADRRQRLEALPGWSWNTRSDQWEEGFSNLEMFSEREGHCRVPHRYKANDGYQLGQWVGDQRAAKNTIDPNRQQRLEALPGWAWDAITEQWEEGFSHLKEFSEREGDCRVPRSFKTDDDYRLGQWVGMQRRTKETIDPDHRQRLEALTGWSWNARSDQWEEGFSQLKEYSDREGHCRVTVTYTASDGYSLGKWVSHQRGSKDKMDLDRRQRLEALPGWVWGVLSGQWEEGYSHLEQFADAEGHCRVPRDYKTDDGYRLGLWISAQRRAKDTMDPDRRRRLEALPGWAWDPLSERWEEGYAHLKQFAEREGHCPTHRYKTDNGYRLGQWVGVQRGAKDTIDPDRRQRLEALPGWSWAVHSDAWEEGVSWLKQFAEREGHCRVAQGYKTDNGYRLGKWVANQRRAKDTIDPDRRQRLAALPGWVWKVEK